MSNKIKHSGIIVSIEKDHMKVRIVQSSACSSCSVAGRCNASESKVKCVDVYHVDCAEDYNVGENVMVTASSRTGFNAVILAFIIPFFILVAALFLTVLITNNEALSAVVSISMLIPYYIVLYMMRNKIGEIISFDIE